MFTEIEVIAFTVLSFAFGIAITIIASVVKGRMIERIEVPVESEMNFDRRISPFIEIHESLMEEPRESIQSDSVNRLKKKIESFKDRNRFYKG